jgi:hypothetical protein
MHEESGSPVGLIFCRTSAARAAPTAANLHVDFCQFYGSSAQATQPYTVFTGNTIGGAIASVVGQPSSDADGGASTSSPKLFACQSRV